MLSFPHQMTPLQKHRWGEIIYFWKQNIYRVEIALDGIFDIFSDCNSNRGSMNRRSFSSITIIFLTIVLRILVLTDACRMQQTFNVSGKHFKPKEHFPAAHSLIHRIQNVLGKQSTVVVIADWILQKILCDTNHEFKY